jgi:hypothetical protein
MKTSLGIWAFGGMATRFNAVGYKPGLMGVSTAEKVGTAVAGLGGLTDDDEFHYPQELNAANLAEVQPYTEDAVGAVKRSVLQWNFIDSIAGKIDEPALQAAQHDKDAVRAYELVYTALGA